jgi:predicted transglutaminase-like cysteine proteinase
MYRKAQILFAAILGSIAIVPSAGAKEMPAFIPLGPEADAPVGFVEMCHRDMRICTLGTPSGRRPGVVVAEAGATSSDPDFVTFVRAISAPASPAMPRDVFDWKIAMAPTAFAAAIPSDARHCLLHDATGCEAAESRQPTRILSAMPGIVWTIKDPAAALGGDNPAVTDAAGSAAQAPERAPSMDLVKAINRNVNRRVRQRTDSQVYGVAEYWTRAGDGPRASGDCEDIALEKRAELIEAGVAADHLFLATVYRPRIGLHTVLVARMAQGDFVLDSLERRVLPWRETRFDWLRLQAPDRPMEWHRLAAL